MNKHKKWVTEPEARLIASQVAAGSSIRSIAIALNRDWKTVKKFAMCSSYVGKSRATKDHVIHRRKLVIQIAEETVQVGQRIRRRFPSALSIASSLKARHKIVVSPKTIVRDLKANGKVRRVRPLTTTGVRTEIEVRKKFASTCLKRGQKWMHKIAFSDESWITSNDHSSRFEWVDDGCDPCCRDRKSKWNVNAIQVWAVIGIGFKSKLIVFPKSKCDKDEGTTKAFRLDSVQYIRRCLSLVVPDLLKYGVTFQFDGARSHIAKNVMSYLENKGVPVITNWPPYSPDLNQIEHLWPELKKRVSNHECTTIAQLTAVAKAEWDAIPQSLVDRYVLGFASACKRVAKS